ncbi:MAG: Sjogren's syndrome/scleroderma autoantigen 1 family protein [Candidatus Hodarchaeota archaeon]
MNPSKNDNSSNEMASLLITGATMLSDSCPDCHIPLFQKDDKIFCPKCKRKAVFVSSDEEAETYHTNRVHSSVLDDLNLILYGKLELLGGKIAALDEPELINQYLQTVQNVLTTLKKIKSLQNLKIDR